ncbi:hypothetical protein GPL06_15125 [Bacteroides salyersiae]|uniref:hypothetical protein n=1 Tax=Bacteroides salyersiae TaxID=291644 RepID=UPI000326DC88|nr:hypothetical protein [Bacteroides salyersiae]EOA47987.1 hypothetical protein HMPREF1532_04049 [Bacteroides salyersiae WAL 10018 = DSM 18765 = JCM 12988]MBT9874120.1 hypothetical protein [Bacteroides salyersiae]
MDFNEQLTTPVLFMVFNRPLQTQRVFESIRKVRPAKLYIAVDGPRDGCQNDIEKREAVLKIIKNVDWECEKHYLIHDKNLGCSKSGPTAWNWVFETEDRVIFVEDDGLGNESAFFFVQDMLEKYKDDERVGYVGAVNYGQTYGDKSYFFTMFPAATYFMGFWKRTQNLYDYELETYEEAIKDGSLRNGYRTSIEWLLGNRLFKNYKRSIRKGCRYNTYDVQISFLVRRFKKCTIYPNINMVSNIGLEGGANNQVNINSKFYKEYGNRKTFQMDSITYCDDVYIDNDFDMSFFNYRCLHNNNWIKVYLKSVLYDHFGGLYRKYIRPIRRRN